MSNDPRSISVTYLWIASSIRDVIPERARRMASAYIHYSPAVALYVVSVLLFTVSRPLAGKDGAFFLATGRRLLQGTIVYEHIWDIKPPAIHLTSAAAGLLSFGSREIHHVLLVLISISAVAGMLGLIAYLLRDLTGSRRVALAGALVPLTFPTLVLQPLGGTRSSLFTALLVVGVAVCVRHRRPVLAGGAAALAAAYWQPLIGLCLILFWTALVTDLSVLRVIAGGLIVAIAMVVPFALVGALPELVNQTIIAAIITRGYDATLVETVHHAYATFGPGTVVVLLGVVVTPLIARQAYATENPTILFVLGAFLWGTIQLVFITFNGIPDAFPFVAVAGVVAGLGIDAVRDGDGTVSRLAVIAIGVVVLAMWVKLLWWSPGGTVHPYTYLQPDATCHLRMSNKEVEWISQVATTKGGECLHHVSATWANQLLPVF